MLVIACPCALGWPRRPPSWSGPGRPPRTASWCGVVRRWSRRKITAIVLDKTGTITRGKPAVAEIVTANLSDAEVLRLAAALEVSSEHPLGEAIVSAARERGELQWWWHESITGKGIEGQVSGHDVWWAIAHS